VSANVAIVGLAFRFPGASDAETFWKNLAGGVESIRTYTREELLAEGMAEGVADHPRLVTAHGAVDDIEGFDAEFFGYSPSEAALIDPQQRLFMECAHEALESGGFVPGDGAPATGVFAGCGVNFYLIRNVAPTLDVDDVAGVYQAILGGEKDFLTSRVSYKLGLIGPAITIQAACATSMVAVHVACQSLLAGECDLAVAGGVSLRIPHASGFIFNEGGIYSADGHCRAFDEQSSGTVSGSGGGAVVLKRLEDAERDGDVIRAVILGTAVSNDGALKQNFTAPGVRGQAAVLAEARAVAGIDPRTIGYSEMHGTGTTLGDPIEIAAVKESLGEAWTSDWRCYIGSLKTNVGHLDTAAGVGGLIKTVLALEHGVVPPSLHFRQPNPKIDFAGGPLRVCAAATPWPETGTPRRASVSSFGLGGSNSHAVLEQAPERPARARRESWRVFPMSARTPRALDAMRARLAQYLTDHPDARLDDVAWTLARGRQVFAHAGIAVARTWADLVRALGSNDWLTDVRPDVAPRVAFLYPGQGAQHVGAGSELYDSEPVFRTAMDDCADALLREGAGDVRALLFRPPTPEAELEIRRTVHAQAVLFALSCALTTWWRDRGIQPSGVAGHSSGEYAAAVCAGVMTMPDAARALMVRARQMDRLPPGAMAAVGLGEADLRRELPPGLEVAAVNADNLCTVAGPEDEVRALEARLSARGVFVHRLQTAHAFHSPAVDPVLPPFRSAMRGVALAMPEVPFYSAVTGRREAAGVTDVDLWVRQIREAVRFGPAVQAMLGDGLTVFLEIGPGSTLSGLVRRAAPQGPLVVPGIPKAREDRAIWQHLGQLWLTGCAIDWQRVAAGDEPRRIPLPTYPYDRKRHWINPPAHSRAGVAPSAAPRATAAERKDTAAPIGFLAPAWRRAPGRRTQDDRRLSGRWLVVAGHGAGDALTARLAAALRADDADVDVRMHVGAADDYSTVDRILVTSTLSAHGIDGFDTLIRLARGIAAQGGAVREIVALTSGAIDVTGAEHLSAWQATVLGPMLVMPEEFPGVACRTIDIDAVESAGTADAVLAELRREPSDRVIALRHGHRWQFHMAPIALPAGAGASGAIRSGGVYLITGGLGALGLTLGRAIAAQPDVALALVARGAVAPGSPSAEAIAALRAAGATVHIYQADCTDRPAMQAVVADLVARYGRIHGAIHAAGVAGGGSIARRSDRDISDVMRPKTIGADVLAEVLDGVPLDFLVFFSSLAAYLPTAGQADYAGANAFLDVRAATLRRQGRRVTAIDWDAWRDVGMAVAADLPEVLRAARERELETIGLDPALACEALWRVIHADLGQVIVTRRAELGQLQEPTEAAVAASGAPAPTDVVEGLKEIWKTLLGVSAISADDDFFQLGGHSLLATSATFQIRQRLGCAVSVDEVFTHSAFGALAALVDGRVGAARDREVLLL
jgi:acyl transferase domain-containing protein